MPLHPLSEQGLIQNRAIMIPVNLLVTHWLSNSIRGKQSHTHFLPPSVRGAVVNVQLADCMFGVLPITVWVCWCRAPRQLPRATWPPNDIEHTSDLIVCHLEGTLGGGGFFLCSGFGEERCEEPRATSKRASRRNVLPGTPCNVWARVCFLAPFLPPPPKPSFLLCRWQQRYVREPSE